MSQGFIKGIPLDTDGTLAANSDLLVPSQKAVKTYVDNHAITPDLVYLKGDGTVSVPMTATEKVQSSVNVFNFLNFM